MLRPALVCLLALSGTGCTMVEGDPHRFEKLAQGIADIPVDGRGSLQRSSAEAGLRPAVRVELLDPHDLWDARDGFIEETVNRAAPAVVETAAPIVVKAVTERAGASLFDDAGRTDGLRSALIPENRHRTIQLGAYSSESAARAAWRGFSSGEASHVLEDLQPRYEQAQVSGRALVRLKVSAPVDRVGDICQSTRIDAPWCAPVA
ncbi:hypothetical protein [Brevundimonas variabilis]|uniref:SPOR domain-containing protein n=1 Tax=Brevundimonas variabilis TaxID=74312 RepID=A0A7W9CGU8_9CAUL|nr:hypothetical protein [Brevundimonas variabilis]MBB5745404.1 hypothetical protein [Brevundimonas variabilis]